MEPQEQTSSPGHLRQTHSHIAQDRIANDHAATPIPDTNTITETSISKQQLIEDDHASSASRKVEASTATLSSPSSPISQSTSTTPSIPSAPMFTRIPGTPPTNPPPRFFTRPYRRPLDHSHHHSSSHGAGYLNSQGSASLGVRSAFKDFVVPAQIILFFSILNALWPTLVRIVTTAIEFLVLVLSSYSACARHSDNCYFLEPLLPDGQEGAYAVTIQWTLRIVFCFLFIGGFTIISKRMEKVWSTLLSNRQRPRSFWSPDNVIPWVISRPGAFLSFIERLLPWKFSRSLRQSTPTRSGHRHRRKASGLQSDDQHYSSSTKSRTNPISTSFRSGLDPRRSNFSSCVDTDAFSAGSGSESRPRSKKSKKSRGPDETTLRETSSMPRSPLHNQTPPIEQTNPESSGLSPPSESSLLAGSPSDFTPGTTSLNNMPVTTATTTSSSSKTGKNNTTIPLATGTSSGIVYETGDDDDFISTDRRRRRRAKGLKTNLDAHSSESLIKPIPCPQEEKDTSNNSQSNQSTVSTRSSPIPDTSKAMGSKISATNKSNTTSSAQSTNTSSSTNVSQDTHVPQKNTVHQNQNVLSTGITSHRNDVKTRNPNHKSAQSKRKDDVDSQSKASSIRTTASTALSPTTPTTIVDSVQDTGYIHPLHALNSTSPIVRLKPSHKRSQSVQLPSVSPWKIPSAGIGASTGLNNTKNEGVSSLKQVTSPVNHKNTSTEVSIGSLSSSGTTPFATANSTESNKSVAAEPGNYDLFGPSSGWYSPFQSGLDISIESDQEKGKHGSRSTTRPRVKADLSSLQLQRPIAGPFLQPSSFFESSPRTPRIMPFSQHHRAASHGFGSAAGVVTGVGSGIGVSLNGNEDWSVRTRSSSIAAPMTPLLESDCVDPMDYFGGSRSASSSRRGSIENNLTESLLSGRARMFASPNSSFGSSQLLQNDVESVQSSVKASGDPRQPSLLGSNFLSSNHFSVPINNRAQAATTAHSSASNSPVLDGQRTLELPMTMMNPTPISTLTTSSGVTGSSLSDVTFEPTTTAMPLMTGMTGMTGMGVATGSTSTTAFVNPWETNHPYKSHSHTVSDTFLPFGLASSNISNHSSNTHDHQLLAEQDRQSSLLQLMNGGRSAGSSIDLGNARDIDPRIGSQLQQHQWDDDESEAIRRGFMFPNLAHHTNLGPTSSLPLHSSDFNSKGNGNTGGFHPFASVEMSLAAMANQPPPLLQEEPRYDFVDLSISDLKNKRGGFASENVSSVGTTSTGSSSGTSGIISAPLSLLSSTGAPRATAVNVGGGTEGSEKKPRERGLRHGRSRSGHHKSASLGSFFSSIPPTNTMSSSSSGAISSVSGGNNEQHGSLGLQYNTVGGGSGVGLEASQPSGGRSFNHGHSRLGRGTVTDGKDGEFRRSRASTGADQPQDAGNCNLGASRNMDGSTRAKRVPKKEHQILTQTP
ncbi:hypothetical protein FBU30_001624 [Linnemannia zychae]|nr:hypothetical protein FBU30_001624 [Linnemannia zychae]